MYVGSLDDHFLHLCQDGCILTQAFFMYLLTVSRLIEEALNG